VHSQAIRQQQLSRIIVNWATPPSIQHGLWAAADDVKQ